MNIQEPLCPHIVYLQALSQFDFIRDKLSLHLIDVSPKMKTMQRTTLCNIGNSQSEEEEVSGNEPQSTKYNDIKVSWHNSIGKYIINKNSNKA